MEKLGKQEGCKTTRIDCFAKKSQTEMAVRAGVLS